MESPLPPSDCDADHPRFGSTLWLLRFLFLLALVGMLAYRTSSTTIDPDLWHEMALGRETVRQGAVPWEDTFAYTPTVSPSVHHEWGTGLIAYCVANSFGETGLSALNLLLIFGLGAICWRCSTKGGASLPVTGSFAIVAILLADQGFSPIRAQMFSFLFTAILCYFLQIDNLGARWWIPCWLAIYVLWLNLHAGFLVGAGLFLMAWFEKWMRGQPHRHLLIVGLVMAPLILLNPYGMQYPAYLWSAVRMDRPLISEWGPLWRSAEFHNLIAFLIAVSLYLISMKRADWKTYPGVGLVAITMVYAVLHTRMLGFFAITWICFVPRHFENSRFAQILRESWRLRPLPWFMIWSAAVLGYGIVNWKVKPWDLRVPGNRLANGKFYANYYPVGPVDYLKGIDFRGNLMVPFDFGAYVIWKTDGRVLVSIDSRYEVAYPPGSLETNYDLYTTGNNAAQVIAETKGTNAILVPEWSPLKKQMSTDLELRQKWEQVYIDDDFQLYLPRGTTKPDSQVDQSGRLLWGEFP